MKAIDVISITPFCMLFYEEAHSHVGQFAINGSR